MENSDSPLPSNDSASEQVTVPSGTAQPSPPQQTADAKRAAMLRRNLVKRKQRSH
ncbi:MAG: hypothetical protein K0U36_02510 [Alphaproteobacteria bacterium]|nr:hypothetical protein [Alphaproteobacteria bacterium]